MNIYHIIEKENKKYYLITHKGQHYIRELNTNSVEIIKWFVVTKKENVYWNTMLNYLDSQLVEELNEEFEKRLPIIIRERKLKRILKNE